MSHRHMPMDVPDPTNPPHYRRAHEHPSGVECIEMVRHMPFCLGNAVKYLYRAGHKGSAAEDYRKAAWYLRKQAEDIRQLASIPEHTLEPLRRWANATAGEPIVLVSLCLVAGTRTHLLMAANECERIARGEP